MKSGLEIQQNQSESCFQKLTFDELHDFLVGHGGHERAVYLRNREADRQWHGKTNTILLFIYPHGNFCCNSSIQPTKDEER